MIKEMKIPAWPLWKQIAERDLDAFNGPAVSERSRTLAPRTRDADKVVKSICPYCAVGCGQDVWVRDGRIIDIEGDSDSPISRGCLCPKGSATFQLVTGSYREHHVLYRSAGRNRLGVHPARTAPWRWWRSASAAPATTQWEDRVRRRASHCNRTPAIAHLGGATLDNEENYLIKKLFTALGIVQIENQARI